MLTIRELIRTLYNAFNQKLKSHRGNWEQNDPTADDYIKNRPFYTDGYVTVVKEKTFSTPEPWCSPFVFEPKEGETYRVVWNDKEYECVAFVFENGLCVGNLSLLMGNGNTGEPFFYFYIDYGGGDIEYACVVQTPGTHTVSISKLNVVKIDKKYIPDIDIEIPETVGIKGIGDNAEVFNGNDASCATGDHAHAEGYSTTASNSGSHAEGRITTASGHASHAEGESTTASGGYSHAEGCLTTASANYAHAEGYATQATSMYSHAEGQATIASSQSQHVQGRYNYEDYYGKYAHIVGNGTATTGRSNAHTLDWDGNAWFAGDVYVGGTSKDTGKRLVNQYEIPSNIVNGSAEGSLRVIGATKESNTNFYKLGEHAFAGGYSSRAAGNYSYAQGYNSWARTRSVNVIGEYNIIEKEECTEATIETTIQFNDFDSVWDVSLSSYKNLINGYFAFSTMSKFGNASQISVGDYIATNLSSTTPQSNKYYEVLSINNNTIECICHYFETPSNIRGQYAHIVGNGTSSTRSNAHTLDWSGNAWFQGTIKIGGTGQDDANAVEVATKADLSAAKSAILLTDQVNGYNYIISMQNGSLTSRCATKSIAVTTMPTKTTYYAGDYIDPTGMTVIATAYDGATRDITDSVDLTGYLSEGDTVVEIVYVDAGITHATTIPVTVNAFDPATVLVDFTYTSNDDGTYTITGWKQTLNGVSSTEMVIPNNALIMV